MPLQTKVVMIACQGAQEVDLIISRDSSSRWTQGPHGVKETAPINNWVICDTAFSSWGQVNVPSAYRSDCSHVLSLG